MKRKVVKWRFLPFVSIHTGVRRPDAQGKTVSYNMIPNDNLMYRSTVQRNGVNVQDANLLKIRVTYLYETKMPLTRYFFTPLMNANLTGVLFGGQPEGITQDTGGRIPLVSYATVRMQSDFKGTSLAAGNSSTPSSPGTPGTPGSSSSGGSGSSGGFGSSSGFGSSGSSSGPGNPGSPGGSGSSSGPTDLSGNPEPTDPPGNPFGCPASPPSPPSPRP